MKAQQQIRSKKIIRIKAYRTGLKLGHQFNSQLYLEVNGLLYL